MGLNNSGNASWASARPIAVVAGLGLILIFCLSVSNASVFGMQDVGRVAPLIDDLYSTDAHLAASAAKDLARRGDPDLARYLIDAADVVDPRARPEVLRALGHFKGHEVSTALSRWLGHGDRDVRLAAVEAISRSPMPDHRSILETTLTDRDPQVRQQALHGLIRLGAESDPTPLLGDLEHRDPKIRVGAANMLGEICSLPHVEAYLENVDDIGARVCAQALSKQRYDVNPTVERAVARALHRLERAGISTCPDADHASVARGDKTSA